jgi:hypothetical protein
VVTTDEVPLAATRDLGMVASSPAGRRDPAGAGQARGAVAEAGARGCRPRVQLRLPPTDAVVPRGPRTHTARRSTPHGSGLGALRWPVEQTIISLRCIGSAACASAGSAAPTSAPRSRGSAARSFAANASSAVLLEGLRCESPNLARSTTLSGRASVTTVAGGEADRPDHSACG